MNRVAVVVMLVGLVATMVIPGFVSEVNTTIPKPGEYPLFCNEYCGLGHHYMWSRVTVTPDTTTN